MIKPFVAGAGIVLAAAVALAVVSESGPDRVAYWKGDNRDRVLVYAGDLDTEAARDALGRAMWTEGQSTAAYLYAAPAAAPAGLAAASYVEARERVEAQAPGWACRLIVNSDGSRFFSGACNAD